MNTRVEELVAQLPKTKVAEVWAELEKRKEWLRGVRHCEWCGQRSADLNSHPRFVAEETAIAFAEALFARQRERPAARSQTKKQKIADELRESDVTARLVGRTDVEYGPHDSLPRGEHVANRRGPE